MSYDISVFWPWLLVALILGLILGWLTDRMRRGEALFSGWRRWAAIAWVVGAVFAFFHWLGGRLGFWLETALLFSAAYFLGCFLGGWLRQLIEGDLPVADRRAGAGAAAATAGAAAAAARSAAAPNAAKPAPAPVAPAAQAVKPPAPQASASASAAVGAASPSLAPVAAGAPPSGSPAAKPAMAPVAASQGSAAPAAGATSAASTPNTGAAQAAPSPSGAPTGSAPVAAPKPATPAPISTGTAHAAAPQAATASAPKQQSAAPAALVSPQPAAPARAATGAESGMAPLLLAAARDGKGDGLGRISAIDGWTEGRLKALGIWHFGQIADWSPANAQWVEHRLALHGRVGDEKWVNQARTLLTAPPAAAATPAAAKPAPSPVAASAPTAPVQNYEVRALAGADGKPDTLTGALGGRGDDLTRIKAVSPRDAGGLNALGIWHFAQIAGWTPANQAWVDGHIGSPGRVESENWVGQAKGFVDSGASKVAKIPLPVMAAALAGSAAGVGSATSSHAPQMAAAPVAASAPASDAAASGDAARAAAAPSHAQQHAATTSAATASGGGSAAHAAQPAAATDVGTAPPLLAAARDGKGDDFTRIHAIDRWTDGRLKALGVWHFGQIADWSPANAQWVERHLSLGARVDDEKWVSQARALLTAPAPAAQAAPKALVATVPAAVAAPVAAPVQNYAVHAVAGEGGKPDTLTGALGGQGDDLTRIIAVTPRDAGGLNALGVWHYAQVAGWTPANQAWVDGHFGAPGRVEHENWAAQSKALVDGGASKVAAIPAPQPAPDLPQRRSMPEPKYVTVVTAPTSVPPSPPTHPEPAAMGTIEGEERHEGARPAGYVGPRGGKGDDLKRIRGIGHQNEGRLHALGIWHFSQIAAWGRDNVKWVGSYLAFPGRIDREEWVAQAKVLAAGGVTDFAKRVDHGDVASSAGGTKEGETNVADLSKAKPHG